MPRGARRADLGSLVLAKLLWNLAEPCFLTPGLAVLMSLGQSREVGEMGQFKEVILLKFSRRLSGFLVIGTTCSRRERAQAEAGSCAERKGE